MAAGDRERTVRSLPLAVTFPVVLTLVLAVATCGLLVARRWTPSDGGGHVDGDMFRRTGLAVDPPDAGATRLRDGMIVQAVDGVTVDNLLRGHRLRRSPEAGDAVTYRVLEEGRARDLQVRMVEPRLGRRLGGLAGGIGLMAFTLLVAGYTLARRRDEPAAAALFAFAGSLMSAIVLAVVAVEPADLAFRPVMWWVSLAVLMLAFSSFQGALAHLTLVFPRAPAFVVARPWVVPVLYLASFGTALTGMIGGVIAGEVSSAFLGTVSGFAAIPATLLVLCGVGNVVVNLFRSRRDGRTRRELALVGGALALSLLTLVGLNLLPNVANISVPEWLYLAVFVPIPVSIAYAVLRRGLFDLDAVVGRTIAYVLTSLTIVAAYVLSVAGLQALFRLSDLSATVVMTAVVAVAFAPVRARIQRAVDRLTYGRRDDPYAILTEVGRGIQASREPAEALQGLVDALAGALRLPYVAVRLDEGAEPVARTGTPAEVLVRVPMIHQGLTLGVLEASARSAGEPFGSADRRLLEDVAGQAAVAADALRLNDALARSRARAVAASEDERQRIRRELHDGLGPALAGISFQLAAAIDQVPSDAPAALAIRRADEAAASAKAEVRRIIDGMAPPQLERQGLMAALRTLGDQLNADPAAGRKGCPLIAVEGPATVGAVPPEIEVGAYRVAAEAMLNARRHSGGELCQVTVQLLPDELRLEVSDDGVGVLDPPTNANGVGLASMRARCDALGGRLTITTDGPGTRVRVSLPTDESAESG